MKTMKTMFTNNIVWCLFAALLITVSCKKDTGFGDFDGDGIQVRINVREGVMNNPNLLQQRSSTSGVRTVADGIQRRTVDLGNDLILVAVLVPEQASLASCMKLSGSRGLKKVGRA